VKASTAVPSRRAACAAVVLLLACAAVTQTGLDRLRRGSEVASPMLYLPSGRYLKIVSLGFDAVVADAIYLWAIQYYGNYSIQDRYNYLEHIFRDVVTELDPHYLDAYLTGSLIMSSEARQPEMALRLLDKGIERNPGAWILAFDAGFLCYQGLKDYPRAATYFEKAVQAPDVHPQVRRFYAEMYRRAGDPRASLREWSGIYSTAGDDYVRTVAWNHVHDLKVQVDLEDLNVAIGAFRGRFARTPLRLQDLVRAGLLAELPLDPEGQPYDYDPRAGEAEYNASRVLGR